MKTAVHTGPKQITIEERPLPQPGPNEYRVRIKACAICGSDVWWPKEILENEPIHGHEACGVVEACGPGASRFSEGDRVVCYAIQKIGNEKAFIEGGFQESSVYHESLLFPLPDDFDYITGSLLSDAIGVPLRGLRRLTPEKSDHVGVWGLGPLGHLQIIFLHGLGVESIIGIDPVEKRRKEALELGASAVLDPMSSDFSESMKQLCGGRGADKAYLYVRHPSATNQAFENTRDGASLCTFVGLEGSFNLPEWYERNLVWSFYFLPEEYEDNIQSVRSAKTDIAKVISHRIPLEDINEAFRLRFECQDESSKIVITMND